MLVKLFCKMQYIHVKMQRIMNSQNSDDLTECAKPLRNKNEKYADKKKHTTDKIRNVLYLRPASTVKISV